MDRPKNFAHFRYVGDKRTQILYDVDTLENEDVLHELLESQAFICFSPDTPAEGRNRGYRLFTG